MRTVIFDLDGTLADTSGDLIAAANACFEGLGLGSPLDRAADAATAFHGGRAMLQLGFERLNAADIAPLVETQFPLLLDHYEAAIDVHTRLYPGAIEAVDKLASAGHPVGICTNKPAYLAEKLLRRLGVRGAFASLIGADTLPVRKPDPRPLAASIERAGGSVRRAVLVGDTITDRQTARAAGIPCVLVTFGPEGRAVAALEPEALLDRFGDLPAIVGGLPG
ncbi:HAD-IA family hydrolase [Tropicimonas sp.]|uniref:HAD-IA family hydrolase n=1 Tax=Tropicimonas sp. TaxID=2067044 RepID=UPI003A85EA1A